MKKCLVAATLIAIFATPALAGEFYLAADLASGKCMVMASPPNPGPVQNDGPLQVQGGSPQGHGQQESGVQVN